MPADQYDLAGFGVGIVDRAKMLGAHRVEAGNAVVAMASSGLHSNGYSLARRIVADLDLSADHGIHVQSLGDALLRPTTIYTRACLELARRRAVNALCHVTGGGIEGNLGRVLPDGLGAVVDTATFTPPDVFGVLQRVGNVAPAEMWRTFNMGAGMLAVVPDGREAVAVLTATGVDAWECGVIDTSGTVSLAGL
jgi:phosphoribosylformylglycinamidine cyclo-ligase